ncbi:hypothetical protein Tco_0901056 [Tanacetum coccineum]
MADETEGKGAAGDSSSGKRKRVENDKLADDNAVYFDSSSSDEDNDLLNDDTNSGLYDGIYLAFRAFVYF